MASHIYIIQDGCNSKIGITTDLEKRIASYKTHNPNFRLVRAFETDTTEARRIERAIVAAFKDKAAGEGKEWFTVEPETMERCVLAFMPRNGGDSLPPTMHEIPLTPEARKTWATIRNAIEMSGTEAATKDARRLWQLQMEWNERFGSDSAKAETPAARKAKAEIDALDTRLGAMSDAKRASKERMMELFADATQLGLPTHQIPGGTVRTGRLGIDWDHCNRDSEIVYRVVRGDFRLPLDDHTEGFFHLSRMASGHWSAVGTARVSMPYLPRLDDRDAWEAVAAAAENLGWLCSMHDEWSWHFPGKTGLILYQPKTPVQTLLQQWDNSFRKWAVERSKVLLMNARGDKDFAKVLDDLAHDETFPLTVCSWDELLETYFDRYWGNDMPDSFKAAYRTLWEKWLDDSHTKRTPD